MKQKISLVLTAVVFLSLLLVSPAFAHDGVGGDELAAADSMLVFALVFFVMGCFWIIFSWQNGELRHPEKAKYIMLERALVDDDGDLVTRYAETEVQF